MTGAPSIRLGLDLQLIASNLDLYTVAGTGQLQSLKLDMISNSS